MFSRPHDRLIRSAMAPVAALLFAVLLSAQQQPFGAQVAVQSDRVYVGQPFVLQIQTQGADRPQKPDLSGLKDFTIQELGGQQNNSQSITIVNGEVTRHETRGYTFNYRLTPKRAGELLIPPITVRAGGAAATTNSVHIRALPPVESNDFKFTLSLSESKCYIGQPVVLVAAWYVGLDVKSFQFNIPILDDPRFTFHDFPLNITANNRDDYVQVRAGNQRLIGKRGVGALAGRQFTTLTFQKVLIPQKTGTIRFPQSSVSGQAVREVRSRSRGIFDDFIGLAGRGQLETFVVPSNETLLEVRDLPAAGRPPNFSGLVGRYKIEADASPNEVNVGDPITLTLRISGSDYLQSIRAPDLRQQAALAHDFRVPEDMAAGSVEKGAKVFTQTIRANNPDIREIPPIELSYFNPDSGQYESAKTPPIPIEVKGTRIVTARDAEGLQGETGIVHTEVESSEGGIAHNYEGDDLLVSQPSGAAAWLRSPLWTLAIGLPPIAYFGLLAFTFLSRRRDESAAARARRAHRELTSQMYALGNGSGPEAAPGTPDGYARLLDSLRRYLSVRLELPRGAMTFADVEPALARRGVEAETLNRIRELFRKCEAGRYAAGAMGDGAVAGLSQEAVSIANELERTLA